MSTFTSTGITLKGAAVIAQSVAGQTLEFTRIVIGDGQLSNSESPLTMTGLKNPVLEVDISSVTSNSEGHATVKGMFSNADLTVGFWYREIGLFALDPDSGLEVLYCYGNAGDNAEWISPIGEASVIEKEVHLVTLIGNATEVTASFKPETPALKAEVDAALALKADLDATDANGGRVLARQMRLDAEQTLYVDAAAVAGGDGSEAKPFKTIQAAIDARYLGAAVIYVKIKPGIYAEKINVPRSPGTTWRFERNGSGVVSVQGGLIDNCSYLVMNGLTFNMQDSDPDTYCVHIANVGNSNLIGITINGKSDKTALHYNNSKGRLVDAVISYAGAALAASDSAIVYAFNLSGVGNGIGVHSTGATIITTNQTLQATTLYERESNGVINPASWQYISDGVTDVTTLPNGIYSIRNGKMAQGLPADYDGTLIVDNLTGHPHLVFYYDAMTRVFHRNYNVNGGIWNEWEEYAPTVASPTTFGLMRVAAVEDETDCQCNDAAITPANFADMGDYRQASTMYSVGAVVRCMYQADLYLQCTTAGKTSANALNTKSVTAGQSITDGTVVWKVVKNITSAGGEFIGAIKFPNGSSIYQNDNANWKTLEVNGNGACLHLRGTGSPKNPNSFGIDLTNGSTTKSLYGSIDGSLLWDGKSIITSSGGNITDVLYFGSDAHVYHINNSSWKSLELDSNSANGSGLHLRSGDSPSLAGTFDLVASINEEGYHLMGSPDGVLTWGGRKIPRIVEVRDLNTPALASLKDASVTISYLTEKQGIRVVIPFFVGGGSSWSRIAMRVTGLNDTGFTVAFFNNSSTTSAQIAYRCVVFEY